MPKAPAPRTHEGRPIVGDLIELRDVGAAAFSKQLAVVNSDRLAASKPGDKVYLVVEAEAVKEDLEVENRAEPLEGGFKRKLIYLARRVAFAPSDGVAGFLDEHADAFRAYEDSLRGQQQLDTEAAAKQKDLADELEDAHLAGKHADAPVEDCPMCDWEGEKAGASDVTDPDD